MPARFRLTRSVRPALPAGQDVINQCMLAAADLRGFKSGVKFLVSSELGGRRILVVEDEWLLADAISDAVREAGGVVLGPVASVREALQLLLDAGAPPDGATLNIRVLDGESYPVADELTRLGVPFFFASANGASSLPTRFARRAIISKPFSPHHIVQALDAVFN